MTQTLLHSKMFDVGNLPVLTFSNCVLKTGVIKQLLKLYVRFFTLLTFFSQNPKNIGLTFNFYLNCCTRFIERWR